ncbi:MAG: sulfotransferase [Deltaproteobacteria bacterium]|nr:sulfotransferase [Deltaproteobacteria bacterium]
MNEIKDGNPSFLLIGHYRCGTSLLRHVINRHSRLLLTTEAHWLPQVFQAGAVFQKFFEVNPVEFELNELPLQRTSRWYHGIRALHSALFEEHRDKIWGMTVIGHGNAAYADYLFTLYGEAKYVLAIRDPRDIYLSYLRTNIGGEYGAYTLKTFLNHLNMNGLPYLVVRYEDMVIDPRRQIERLCCFLGVDYEPGMLEPLTRRLSGNLTPALQRAALNEEYPVGNRALVERWKSQLTDEALLRLNDQVDAIDQLGYPVVRAEGAGLRHSIRDEVSGTLIGMKDSLTKRDCFSGALPERVDILSAGAFGIRFQNRPGNGTARIRIDGFGELAESMESPLLYYHAVYGSPLPFHPVYGESFPTERKWKYLLKQNKRRLLLFSAGGATRAFLSGQTIPTSEFEIVGVIDNHKRGFMDHGGKRYRIYPLKKALEVDHDAILITSPTFRHEIKECLVKCGLRENRDFYCFFPSRCAGSGKFE